MKNIHATNDEEAIEELADLLEILHSLAKIHHSTIKEVEEVRKKKEETRGGFTNKTFLVEVED